MPVVDQMMLHVLTTTTELSVPVDAGSAIGKKWRGLEK